MLWGEFSFCTFYGYVCTGKEWNFKNKKLFHKVSLRLCFGKWKCTILRGHLIYFTRKKEDSVNLPQQKCQWDRQKSLLSDVQARNFHLVSYENWLKHICTVLTALNYQRAFLNVHRVQTKVHVTLCCKCNSGKEKVSLMPPTARNTFKKNAIIIVDPVVQRVDSDIPWTRHYPVKRFW